MISTGVLCRTLSKPANCSVKTTAADNRIHPLVRQDCPVHGGDAEGRRILLQGFEPATNKDILGTSPHTLLLQTFDLNWFILIQPTTTTQHWWNRRNDKNETFDLIWSIPIPATEIATFEKIYNSNISQHNLPIAVSKPGNLLLGIDNGSLPTTQPSNRREQKWKLGFLRSEDRTIWEEEDQAVRMEFPGHIRTNRVSESVNPHRSKIGNFIS